MRKKRKKWKLLLLAGFAVITAAAVADYFVYPRLAVGGRSFNRGENALWLRYTWYFGEHKPQEVHALAQRLRDAQIRYAYLHVRYIKRDGTLRFRFADRAKRVLGMLRKDAPGLRLIAYVYAGNRRGEGGVDLANPAVRRAMAGEAAWLTRSCGFDGVQWDYEIAENDDPDFLALLRETRAALPRRCILSVATPMWLPRILLHWGWSDEYFAKVTANCDQVAVMCYDSGFWMPRSYAWLVHQQAVHVTQDAEKGSAHCRVLLGLPTYGKGMLSHNPAAENLRNALKGVREGMSDPKARAGSFAGVALFADYTTDDSEWRTYRDLWLTR